MQTEATSASAFAAAIAAAEAAIEAAQNAAAAIWGISGIPDLISQVAEELWEVTNKTIKNLTKQDISIIDYKKNLVKQSKHFESLDYDGCDGFVRCPPVFPSSVLAPIQSPFLSFFLRHRSV